jgi:EAL domain-containing protein (putative c-di-GMP-specific phosphodiesterase class I)
VLEGLNEIEVQLAPDEFGAGNSSLLPLRHLPISALTNHRSFLRGFPESTGDQFDATLYGRCNQYSEFNPALFFPSRSVPPAGIGTSGLFE